MHRQMLCPAEKAGKHLAMYESRSLRQARPKAEFVDLSRIARYYSLTGIFNCFLL